MLSKWGKRLIGLIVVALFVAATIYALMPQPVPVDVAVVDRGRMQVTIDEEGVARIRDVFRVSTPIAGRVDRLPVEVGDKVHRNTSAIAVIHPSDPPFLDVRSRREMQAAVNAAHATVALARAQIAEAEAGKRLAQADLDRAERLSKLGTVSLRVFEKAVADLDSANAAVEQAMANLALRESELASAEARLIEPDELEGGSGDACCVTVWAPVDGTVLKLLTESEQVVAAGAGLLEIGDPTDLEIIVHLLSSDAVGIAPGAQAYLDDWGGSRLAAKVRRINPAAYMKVSALGIEEQRVDAILDLADPRESWQRLGHEFRVMIHISTWEAEDVVRVPLGALFRRGNQWSVFRVIDGKAALTPVDIGHRNDLVAEVVKGLAPGDKVVLHPSDRVTDGVGVTLRDDTG